MRVLVDPVVELKLKFFLRHFDEEIPNLFRNSVAHVTKHQAEVRVNASPDFLHKHVLTLHGGGKLSGTKLVAGRNGPALSVELLLLFFLLLRLGDKVATVFLVVLIVGEDVVLLGIDDGFDNFAGMVTLGTEHLGDDVHDNWAHGGEPHKDTLNYAAGQLLELTVHV